MERKRRKRVVARLYDCMRLSEIKECVTKAENEAKNDDIIDLRLDIFHDEYGVTMNIIGSGWETDSEMQERLASEARIEERNRAYYEELKAKYES